MKKIVKLVLIGFSLFLIYEVISYFLTDVKLVNGNSEFVKKILQDSNYHLLYEKQNKNIISKFIKLTNHVEINKPVTLLESSFSYNNKPALVYMQNSLESKPRVYIYSTHQGEEYSGEGLLEYGINPGVMMASYIMQDKLNNLGIETLVEERSVADYLKEHNINYKQSYQATRYFLTTTLEKYNDFDLVIDLHRDALSKSLSTIKINGKSYAKILFVMNPNYDSNIALVKRLNNTINKKYPGLSRGIYDKYRDTFNQDLNKNALLLEVGGQLNTIDEVINTIDAVVEAIEENI